SLMMGFDQTTRINSVANAGEGGTLRAKALDVYSPCGAGPAMGGRRRHWGGRRLRRPKSPARQSRQRSGLSIVPRRREAAGGEAAGGQCYPVRSNRGRVGSLFGGDTMVC